VFKSSSLLVRSLFTKLLFVSISCCRLLVVIKKKGGCKGDPLVLSVLATPFLWSKGKEMAIKSDVVNGEKDEVS